MLKLLIPGVAAVLALLSHLIIWTVNTEGYKISFSQLRALYNINPEKWELMDDIVVYKSSSTVWWKKFYFSIPDTMRYHRWKKRMEKDRDQRQYREMMEAMTKEWLKDIEIYRRKTQDFADVKTTDRTGSENSEKHKEESNGKRDADFIHIVC